MEEYLKDGAFGEGLTDKEETEVIDDAPEWVFSTDEEIFYDDIDELDLGGAEDGDKVIIYRGKPVKVTHIDFLQEVSIVELLQNAAYDEDGEMAEDYLMDVTEDIEAEIMEAVNNVLCKYVAQPNYHRVADIQPMTIAVGEFE